MSIRTYHRIDDGPGRCLVATGSKRISLFLVRMEHPDGDGWGRHVVGHLAYLKRLIDAGQLLASGPLKGLERRNGFLILAAASRAEAEALIAADPFAIHDLIVDLRIEEWGPLFGAFADRSSGDVPDAVKAMFAG